MRPLTKTTIVIWSEVDDTNDTHGRTRELGDLARDAEYGSSYCSKLDAVLVTNPEDDPDWEDTEFFDEGEA